VGAEIDVERSQDKAVGELVALWTALFGGPPPVKGSPSLLAELMVRHMPGAPSYGPDSRPPRP
jgi:hypothetical protein